jgi:hypothetical protein
MLSILSSTVCSILFIFCTYLFHANTEYNEYDDYNTYRYIMTGSVYVSALLALYVLYLNGKFIREGIQEYKTLVQSQCDDKFVQVKQTCEKDEKLVYEYLSMVSSATLVGLLIGLIFYQISWKHTMFFMISIAISVYSLYLKSQIVSQ